MTDSKFILGIDPGKQGGLALVKLQSGELLDAIRMPTLQHRKRVLVDAIRIHEWLGDIKPYAAAVEQVNAMPKQGSVSGFTFGRMAGAAEAVALSVSKRVEWVTPVVWKKYMGLTSSKQASLDMARLVFGLNPKWEVKANEGCAEAALIAEWYRRAIYNVAKAA